MVEELAEGSEVDCLEFKISCVLLPMLLLFACSRCLVMMILLFGIRVPYFIILCNTMNNNEELS
jgi:hypothetical protein